MQVNQSRFKLRKNCTYLEIHGFELLRLVSNDKWNSIWENFFAIIPRTGSVAVENPFIQFWLDPWDSNPSKNKAGMEMVKMSENTHNWEPLTSQEAYQCCTTLNWHPFWTNLQILVQNPDRKLTSWLQIWHCFSSASSDAAKFQQVLDQGHDMQVYVYLRHHNSLIWGHFGSSRE